MKVGFFYDYDLTLSEEFQQFPVFRAFADNLKKKYGIDSPEQYWTVCEGSDLGVNWMGQFIMDSQDVFERLTNERMIQEFAPQVKLAPGLPSWFERLREKASSLGMEVENHVITAGAVPLVKGSAIFPYLTSLIGGEFLEDENGISKINSVVEPFRKVEHFKRICKGEDLHHDLAMGDYHINYRNAFYFGDGQSDKDLFRYLNQRGGVSVGVYEKTNMVAFQKAISVLGSENPFNSSVKLIAPRDYSEGSILEKKVFEFLELMKEGEDKCDMGWELVHDVKLKQVRNKEIVDIVENHVKSCDYCQKMSRTYFEFG